MFAKMEQRVMGAEHIEFEVESSGAFESSFEGWIHREGRELAMAAHGVWGGEPVTVSAETTRDLLVLNTPAQMERVKKEPFLSTAVLIGLTRMGVLHNLARLIAGKAPDHDGGGVREWVEAENIEFVGDDRNSIRFDIIVDGTRSAVATIRVDPRSGLPLQREQTVEFSQGSMTVVETYRF
ncbi:MAG: hypothetical protein KY432_03415 [Acidobacteria bacterium]|nr:hypothetical protein [Acidobacteriota bacterium]